MFFHHRTPDTLLMVFARYPEPGKVKTRLARDLNEDAACNIYSACLERTFKNVEKHAGKGFSDIRICSAETPLKRWKKRILSCQVLTLS